MSRRINSVNENGNGVGGRYAGGRYIRSSNQNFRENQTYIKKRSSSMNSLLDPETFKTTKDKQLMTSGQKLLNFFQKKFGIRRKSSEKEPPNGREFPFVRRRSAATHEEFNERQIYRRRAITNSHQDLNETFHEDSPGTGLTNNIRKIVRRLSTRSRTRDSESNLALDSSQSIRQYGQSQFLNAPKSNNRPTNYPKQTKTLRPYSELNSHIFSQSCSSLVSDTFSSGHFGSQSCLSSEEAKNSDLPPKRGKWMRTSSLGPKRKDLTKERQDISLKISVLEVKNISEDKRYYCEIHLDHTLHARTSVKLHKDILFWGEEFNFTNLQDFNLIVIQLWCIWDRRKKRNERRGDCLVASLTIPVVNIWMKSEFEEWWKMESVSTNYSSTERLYLTRNMDPVNSMVLKAPTSYKPLHSSDVTNIPNSNRKSLQNRGSMLFPQIRLKLRYQRLEILPLKQYCELSQILEENTVPLLSNLEKYIAAKAMEDLSFSIVSVFCKRNQATQLLPQLVVNEITKLDNESLAFRGNSIATKSMDCFMKIVGQEYLSRTLAEFVHHILIGGEDCEVDPSRLSQYAPQIDSTAQLEKNQKRLRELASMATQKIFKSITYFPAPLLEVFTEIRSLLEGSNGLKTDVCDSVISGCIFLRFFCPAILSPSLFGLAKNFPDDPKKLRTLTLIAKTLQSLANSSLFHAKESYMQFLNTFVENNIPHMKNFLQNISKTDNTTECSYECKDDMTLRIGRSSRPQNQYRNTICQSKLSLISTNTLPDDSLKSEHEVSIARDFAVIHKQLNEIVKKIGEEDHSDMVLRLKRILSHLDDSVNDFMSQRNSSIDSPDNKQNNSFENSPKFGLWPEESFESNTSIDLDEPPDSVLGNSVLPKENFSSHGIDQDLESPKIQKDCQHYSPKNIGAGNHTDSWSPLYSSTRRNRLGHVDEERFQTRPDSSMGSVESLRRQIRQLQKKLEFAYEKLEEVERERTFFMLHYETHPPPRKS